MLIAVKAQEMSWRLRTDLLCYTLADLPRRSEPVCCAWKPTFHWWGYHRLPNRLSLNLAIWIGGIQTHPHLETIGFPGFIRLVVQLGSIRTIWLVVSTRPKIHQSNWTIIPPTIIPLWCGNWQMWSLWNKSFPVRVLPWCWWFCGRSASSCKYSDLSPMVYK